MWNGRLHTEVNYLLKTLNKPNTSVCTQYTLGDKRPLILCGKAGNAVQLCQQHARNRNSYPLQFNNCSFSQETCTCLYPTISTVSSSPKQSRTPLLQRLPLKRWINTGITVAPSEADRGLLSQFRCGWTRAAVTLTHSGCAESQSFLQLFVNYEEEHDLR